MKKPIWSFIGFMLFALGILSIILSLVGLKFTFLGFLYNHGLATIIFQLVLLFGGMILWYVSRINTEEE